MSSVAHAPPATRLMRRLLLAILLGIAASVAWTYRRSSTAGPASAQGSPPAPGSSRTENLVFKKFQGEHQSFELRAGEMVGKEEEELRLRRVTFKFTYTAQGKPGAGTIVADECAYTPALQRAVFHGNVVVTTEEGFELRTESLIYRGDKGLTKSEQPVAFRRKDVSGTSTGFSYVAEEGKLELPADVVVTVQDEHNPATEIRAARAALVRAEKTLRFADGVTIRQGTDLLTARQFEADFGDDHAIYRARAIDDVEVKAAGALPGTASLPGASGPRHLRCRKLDLWFTGTRKLKEATAGPDADLVVMPGPKDPPERRHLGARFLTFVYDEQGRLTEVRGQKDSWLDIEPIPPAKGQRRHLASQTFLARLNPVSTAIEFAEFTKDVQFVEGKRKGSGQKAYFDSASGVLSLKEDPELIDEEQGSRLRAEAIDVNSRTGDVAARHNVRHVLERRQGGQGLLSGSGEPVLVTSRFLDYDGQKHVARYREQALLRAGRDEIRAPEIRLHDETAGRRLEAEGGVVSLLHPRREGKTQPAAAFDARARQMVYEEARGQMSYTGEVAIRQGDLAVRGPAATLQLTPDGGEVKTMVAGEPVEVQQADRRARGKRAVYEPAAGTMKLVGEPVTLIDPRQNVQGRAVTFSLGNDRVVVEGEEQARTQTVIRPRQEPPRP